MFIVSKDGNRCEEIKTLEKQYKLSEDGERELQRIKDNSTTYFNPRIMGYEYTGYENADDLKKDIERCYAKHEECIILINGIIFGKYKKGVGDEIFNGIIYNLDKGTEVYDLRNWEGIKQ